ncbi:MAG: hypothetical protein Q9191_000610 [Dirinaria sp. TL-2023a]
MSTLPHGVLDPAAPANSALPPPAPPLPPQHYGHRAANALARFAQPFIHGSRPPSASGDRPSGFTSHSPSSLIVPSALSSKTTTHKTGIPIAALDKSPDSTHAILAGRDILKTIQVSGTSCTEEFNLRSHIIAYAAAHKNAGEASSGRYKDHLAANDVKWSHGRYDTTIATAAANGQIVIYDLNRRDVELARLHEHNRQVHRIAFNPHQGALLLSGSQDATVRLWDMRETGVDNGLVSGRSVGKYSLNNEGIRDLQWSPTNGVEFAAGTDNGVIQRWDFRKNNSPLLKVNAHEKTCHSIDWHPDGKHLASGGADKNIKVWDFSSTDRRMKVAWQIRAPQAVLNVRWRPPWSTASGQGLYNWECTQLAASYDQLDPQIHIWDLRRPYMPCRQLGRYDNPTAALLWHSESLLWSVGTAGMFVQTDVEHTSSVLDQRSPNVIAVAPTGQMRIFAEKRSRRHNALESMPHDFIADMRERGSSDERLSTSHNTTIGSHEEPSLLSTSFKARQWKAASTRPSKLVASTPPSAGSGGQVLKLDESLQKEFLHCPTQVGASGHVLGVFDDNVFKFLACNYKPLSLTLKADMQRNLHESISEVFEYNASLAACAAQHRLAHSWRVLAMVVRKELKKRAEVNFALRRKGAIAFTSLANSVTSQSRHRKESEVALGSKVDHGLSDDEGLGGPSKLSAFHKQENSSNLTTPLARPVPDPPLVQDRFRSSALRDEGDTFSLPIPALAKPNSRRSIPDRKGLENMANGNVATMTNQGSSENEQEELVYHTPSIPPVTGFLDLDLQMSERRAAMSNYRTQPRPPLRLDDPFHLQGEGFLAPSLGREDSDESFQIFSASTESSQRAASIGGSFGSNRSSDKSDLAQERSNFGHNTSSEDHMELGNSYLMFESHESHLTPLNDPSLPKSTQENSQLTTTGGYPTAPPPTLIPRFNPQPPVIHLNDIDIPEGLKSPSEDLSSPSHFTPFDYLRFTSELPSKPWDINSLVLALVNYHITTLLDSQTPAILLLSLLPFFPCLLPPSLITSVLLSYHNQLTSLSLHTQAAELRNLAYPTNHEVYEYGTYGIVSGRGWCSVCQKPSKGGREGHCARCRQHWGPCPICNDEGPLPLPRSARVQGFEYINASKLWGWCQVCAHGGHLSCLRTWWSDIQIGEGGCATIGCLHDCIAGIRRDDNVRRAAEERKADSVKGDEWIVGESAAVGKARDLVGSRGEGIEKGRSEGRGPLSAGLGGRSASGGKKVRLIVPGAEANSGSHTVEATTSASVP